MTNGTLKGSDAETRVNRSENLTAKRYAKIYSG